MFKTIRNMKVRDERGFTLVELLIVIAIIAILAAIAIPQFAAYRQRAIEASMLSDVRSAATAVTALHTDAMTYAGLGITAGTAGPGPGTVTWTITVGARTFTATSPLSAGNTASVATPAATVDTFAIRINNPAARENRRNVTINQAGEINWTN